MIVENLVSLMLSNVQGFFSMLQIVTLPLDFITVLLDILCYGVWVIGADLFLITITLITGWLVFKFTAGLALFLWRLLPLT